MRYCPVGAVLSDEELVILERACALAVKFGEHALKLSAGPAAQRRSLRRGIQIYRSYQKKIQKVRSAKDRA